MPDVNVTITNLLASDATTFASAPTENHGQSGLLALDSGAFIWFGIDIPATVTDANKVVSAKLRMKTGQAGNQNLILMWPGSAWTESTITHSNRPTTSDIRTISMGSTAANVVKEFDITSEFKSFVRGDWPTANGLAFRGSSASGRVTFYSGEMGLPDGAQLVIVYTTTNISPAAPVSTGSGLMGNHIGRAQVDKNVLAEPFIGTALFRDAPVILRNDMVATKDIGTNATDFLPGSATQDSLLVQLPNRKGLFAFEAPVGLTQAAQITSVVLQLSSINLSTNGFITLNELANEFWESSTGTAPALGAQIGSAVAINANSTSSIDITQYVKDILNGLKPNNGIAVTSGQEIYIATRENSNPALRPTMAFTYNPVQPVNRTIPVPPFEGSADMFGSSVSVGKSVTVVANAALSSGEMVQPVIDAVTNPDVFIAVDPALASADMPDANVVASVSVSTTADVMTGSALSLDATVSFITSVNVQEQPGTSTARMITPAINGRDISFYDDPYYVLTRQTTDDDDIWYRFKEEAGAAVVKDETIALVNNVNNDGILVGNPEFVQGYGTHRALAFDGVDDAIVIPEDASRPALQPGSLEFYVNTSVKNQPVLFGQGFLDVGNGSGPGVIGSGETPRTTTIELVDGKVNLVNRLTSATQPALIGEMTGVTDVADGQWHQIVVTTWWYPQIADSNSVKNNESVRDYEAGTGGMSIYVDGKLDQRKVFNYGQDTFKSVYIASPDQIGRVGNRYFQGLMSEFVFRKFSAINKYYIEQLKYAFFQNNPIKAGIMGANAVAGNAKGKGNTKRVLALYFRFTDPFFPNTYSYGLDYEWASGEKDKTTPMFGGFTSTPKANSAVDVADDMNFLQGAVVNFKNVYQVGTQQRAEDLYRDPITDEPRYINLQTDIDIEDYDAMFFVDFPGDQFGPVKKGRNGDQFDKFIESVKKAVFDDGLNLYVSQPHVAEYLGIVNGYESKTIARDSRLIPTASIPTSIGQAGMFGGDWKAAYNDVFKNPDARLGIDSAARIAYANEHYDEYFDTHTNSKHRIAALIPGITDLKGYTFDEEIQWADLELSWLLEPQEAFRYTDHPNGLKLGDEFKFNGPLSASTLYQARIVQPPQFRLISYRPDQIRVGVALAKEQLYVNDEKLNGYGDKLNPSRENATVIVVQPGSELDGRVINGRIVINSNDTVIPASYTASIQDLEDESWSNAFGWEKETAETRKWTMASNRIPYKMMKVNFTSERIVSRKDGAIAVIAEEHTRDLAEYGQQKTIRVDFTDMSERLWNYVLEAEPDVGDGGVRINAAHMSASANAINPALGVVANVNIVAQSAYGVASMGKVAQDASGENQVFAFAATATASMGQPGKTIKAEAMTANGVMVDPVGIAFDTEDIIYLTLATPGSVVLTRNGDSV